MPGESKSDRPQILAFLAGVGCTLFCLVPSGAALVLWLVPDPDLATGFEQEYGIEIMPMTEEMTRAWWSEVAQGTPPSPETARAATLEIVEELRAYPPELLDAASILRVVLADDLETSGRNVGGCAAAEIGTIYLNTRDVRYVIHHEVGHMIDVTTDTSDMDFRWYRLNPREFSYGVQNMPKIAFWGSHELREPGFCTPYAMMNIGEDKAETFNCMRTRPGWLRHAMKDDPVLAKKVALLADHLADFHPFFEGEF